jgi:hypothetical protein
MLHHLSHNPSSFDFTFFVFFPDRLSH